MGQTVSRDFWKSRYKEHEEIVFHICDYIVQEQELSKEKKQYIITKIIVQMIDSQIFMYDQVMRWDELDIFLSRLKQYDAIWTSCMAYEENKKEDSYLILQHYEYAQEISKHLEEEQWLPIIKQHKKIDKRYVNCMSD